MTQLAKLSKLFETKPLILLKLPDGYERALLESKRGLDHFTVAKPHEIFHDLKTPALCLVEMVDEESHQCYVGVVKSKAPVTTFDSRLTIVKLRPLNLISFNDLTTELLRKPFQTALRQKLAAKDVALCLTPKLSSAIIEALSSNLENKKAIEAAAFNIPKLRPMPVLEWEQFDALKMAIAAFGISKADLPKLIEIPHDSDSSLNYLGIKESRALEDNVIAKDASVIPGFHLIEKYVTGRAVFQKEGEQLVVYTANRGPLEIMLGVDLIYINETVGNTVMVQYKMLKEKYNAITESTDWIFSLDDQFNKEVARMKLPSAVGEIGDYRLHRNPFFFKFVRKKGDGESHQSFIISFDHLNQVIASPKSKGLKGGIRISYEDLAGVYLRESDLIGLIRSGYIGTHRIESDSLSPIISEVAKGNRALVLAWQQKVHKGVRS